jgi:membrane peptidoglycan carboxypeptidase
MKTKLDALVATGTITQEQADAAFAIITATTGRIDFSALPAEVSAALKASMGKGHGGVFSDLTADQQTAVKTVMDESMNSALASLVTAGTITQAQSDAITAEPRDKTAMKSLTTEQRDAVRTAIDAARDAGLATLVTNGTLTQAQADRMGKGGPGGRGHGGPGAPGGPCGDRGERGAAPTTTATAGI